MFEFCFSSVFPWHDLLSCSPSVGSPDITQHHENTNGEGDRSPTEDLCPVWDRALLSCVHRMWVPYRIVEWIQVL